ncbi:MAG TPA: NAD(P)/FAD-dependent oxidoreductase [Blastocatellia bacterium]|nr:NAD(P)/FAD-dependent oxidoreductase [Blastocatellia bacterium]
MGSNVVIVGGGFAGLYAALELEKLLKRKSHITVTLLNSENFFLFTPMLPETGASSIGTRHIVSPLRKLLRRTRFAEVTVEAIKLDSRVVSARHSLTGAALEFSYDHLVLTLGGVTNYFGVPGAAEYSIPFKTLGDAIYVRNHTIDKLEEAAVEPERVEELLTFVVVGGGLTGVEVSGALNDFVRDAAEYYPEIDRKRIRVMLVEAGPRLMPEMNEELAKFAEKVMRERGVDVRTRTSVVKVEEDGFELSTGERIQTQTLIWGAGVAPNPLIATLDVPKERGRIRVNEYLEVEGLTNLWALGDCAHIPDPRTGKPHPPTAQHAVREGKRAARNIAASFGIGMRQPFDYRTMGQMAIVGERTGVADVMGHRFSGLFAWFLWRTYYLNRIPQLEKRVRVMLDWTLDLFFSRDLVQLAVTRERRLTSGARNVSPLLEKVSK